MGGREGGREGGECAHQVMFTVGGVAYSDIIGLCVQAYKGPGRVYGVEGGSVHCSGLHPLTNLKIYGGGGGGGGEGGVVTDSVYVVCLNM